jgi:uncharacterized membrane protein YpjA
MVEGAQAVMAIVSMVAVAGLISGAIWAWRRLRGQPASRWLLAPLTAVAVLLAVLTLASFPFELSGSAVNEARDSAP